MKQKHQSLERSSQRSLNAKHLLFTLMLLLSMTACNNDEPVVNNYYIDDNPAVVQGQLSGKFSVSPTKKVSFSQGNLQYNAVQNVWRFATNQYDFVGDASKGTVKIGTTPCDNSLISNDYNGWIDLFGWGTGDNPTMSSTENADYPKFVDWGAHIIDNGGGKVNLWRTLTNDEWVYLFHGRKDADRKFALGHIYITSDKSKSVNGVIILPDKWKQPDDIDFYPSVDKGMEWRESIFYYYDANMVNHYFDNSYTLDKWAKLDSLGAVFLPAAGFRYDGNVIAIGSYLKYWSATSYSTSQAYALFGDVRLLDTNFAIRPYGYSVRLVR